MNKKPITSLLLVLSMTGILSACNSATKCTHENVITTIEALASTCTSKGHTAQLECEKCGEVIDESHEIDIDPNAHSFVREVEESSFLKTEGSCLEGAIYYRSCEYCHTSSKGKDGESTFQASINPASHKFTLEVKDAEYLKTAGDCQTKAVYFKSCEVCHLSSEGTDYEATFEIDIDPNAHKFTEEIASTNYLKTSGTCSSRAEYYKSCEVCHTSSKDLPGEATFYGDYDSNNHEVKWRHFKTVAPTENERGIRDFYASCLHKHGEEDIKFAPNSGVNYEEVELTDNEISTLRNSSTHLALIPSISEAKEMAKTVSSCAVMLNDEVTLPGDLSQLTNLEYISESIKGTEGKIEFVNDKAIATKRGVANLTIKYFGEEIASNVEVKILDETLVDQGKWYNKEGNYASCVGGETSNYQLYNIAVYPSEQATEFWAFDQGSEIKTGKLLSEEDKENSTIDFEDKGNVVELKSNSGVIGVKQAFEYSKEELALLMQAGYSQVDIPVYLKADANLDFLKSNIADRYIDFVDMYTINEKMTGQNNPVCRTYITYNTGVNYSRLYLNRWQTVTVSLKAIYDNYDQVASIKVSDNTSYEVRNFPLFNVVCANTGMEKYNFDWTFYLGDVKVSKGGQSEFVGAVDNSGNIVLGDNGEQLSIYPSLDMTNDNIDTAIASWDSANGVFPRTTVVDGNLLGSASLIGGEIGGKTPLNGKYILQSNAYKNTGALTSATSAPNRSKANAVFLNKFGYSKTELQALKNAGYTKLTYETLCNQWSSDMKEQATYVLQANGHKWNKASITHGEWVESFITIDALIAAYDNFFDPTGANGQYAIIQDNGGCASATSFDTVLGNFKAVK